MGFVQEDGVLKFDIWLGKFIVIILSKFKESGSRDTENHIMFCLYFFNFVLFRLVQYDLMSNKKSSNGRHRHAGQ